MTGLLSILRAASQPNNQQTHIEGKEMKHQIHLSNGQVLQIEEGQNSLHIASMLNGEVDSYICEINANGVLVMPNSGTAGECLTQGLKLD